MSILVWMQPVTGTPIDRLGPGIRDIVSCYE